MFTQYHLLNPRACSAYLRSEDAAQSQDPEVQAAVLSTLIADDDEDSDPRQQSQTARRSAVAGHGPGETAALAVSIIHAQAPTAAAPPAIQQQQPYGGELGFLQRLADAGGAEGLLLALTRRCDTLEAQNAVLRTKVMQLYPPGVCAIGTFVYAWVASEGEGWDWGIWGTAVRVGCMAVVPTRCACMHACMHGFRTTQRWDVCIWWEAAGAAQCCVTYLVAFAWGVHGAWQSVPSISEGCTAVQRQKNMICALSQYTPPVVALVALVALAVDDPPPAALLCAADSLIVWFKFP